MAWEDVAYGPDVSSSGGWEDVAYGPETTTPSLFSDPIGALTSKDWWLTRPSGERISAEQAVVGPLVSALKGVPIIGGAADEIIASAAGGDYDQQLQKIRGYQDSFAEASPIANVGLQLATGLKAPLPDIFSKAPGITPALGNVAKLGALGVGLSGASGFGEGEGGFENRLQSAQDAAKWGGLAGLGLGAAGQAFTSSASKLAGVADDLSMQTPVRDGLDLLSQIASKKNLAATGIAGMIPGAAPIIATQRGLSLASKAFPQQMSKVAEKVSTLIDKGSNITKLIAPGANLAGAASAIKAPKEMIDRAMDKAEEKIMTPPELKAPEILSATRIKEKPLTDIDPSSLASPLVDAVIMQESGGKSKAVSPKGAKGLMQLMPETAKEVAKELGLEDYDLNDPDTNRMMGEYYLSKMMKIFKDEKLALAAYNAGPGKVQMWVKKYGKSWDKIVAGINRDIEDGKLNPQYYMETRKYVPSIWRRYEKNKSIKV